MGHHAHQIMPHPYFNRVVNGGFERDFFCRHKFDYALREFVRWWREMVRGKGEKANSADRGYFVDAAESITGISHQQVSRWAKCLKDRNAHPWLLSRNALTHSAGHLVALAMASLAAGHAARGSVA
jgi:hypothetical protein